jgi:LPXTG-motif cell wall-anchored protein
MPALTLEQEQAQEEAGMDFSTAEASELTAENDLVEFEQLDSGQAVSETESVESETASNIVQTDYQAENTEGEVAGSTENTDVSSDETAQPTDATDEIQVLSDEQQGAEDFVEPEEIEEEEIQQADESMAVEMDAEDGTELELQSDTVDEIDAESTEELDEEFAAEEDYSIMTIAETDPTTTGINLSEAGKNYIKATTLSYKCPDISGMDWTVVTDDVTLHGDDSLKLIEEFQNFTIKDVKDHNYSAYYKLPDWMKGNAQSLQSSKDENGKEVFQYYATEDYLIIAFNQEWINGHIESQALAGSAEMQAVMNVTVIEGSTVLINGQSVNVDYESQEAWDSKYATIDIEKSEGTYIEQADDYDLLQYTLTVTNGDVEMKDIRVEDTYDDIVSGSTTTDVNATMVDSIVGVTSTETSISGSNPAEISSANGTAGKISYTDGVMVWNIGTMAAGETRTLTYQVKLKKEVTGLSHSSKYPLHNMATLYSGENKRKTADSTFNLYGKTDMSKWVEWKLDEDGVGATATYYITIKADANNNYVMDNLKIFDAFAQDSTYPDYTGWAPVEFVKESLHLYKGVRSNDNYQTVDGLTEVTDLKSLNPTAGAENPIIKTNPDYKKADDPKQVNNPEKSTSFPWPKERTDEEKENTFDTLTCYIGDLKPGERATLVYQVKVQDSAFLTNTGKIQLINIAHLYDDDTKHKIDMVRIGNYSGYISDARTNNTYYTNIWEKKYEGERQLEAQEVTLGDNLYEYKDDGLIGQSDSADTSFTAPFGSYRYDVIINDDGLADVTTAVMSDTLTVPASYGVTSVYVGYARIEAFASLDSSKRDGGVADGTSPKRTAWLKVDGLSKLTFTLGDLGFTGHDAYRITYYTDVVGTMTGLYAMVGNSFEMSGGVGTGGIYILQSGMKVSTSTKFMLALSFNAEKSAWYYEPAQSNGDADFSQGTLYWYVKLSGTSIPAGQVIWDKVTDSSGNKDPYHQLLKDKSFLGIYEASTTAELEGSYKALTKSTTFTKRNDIAYTVEYPEEDAAGQTLKITFPNEVRLDADKNLYLVIRTSVIGHASNTQSYNNSLYLNANAAYLRTVSESVVYGDKVIDKDIGCSSGLTWDGGSTFHFLSRDDHPDSYYLTLAPGYTCVLPGPGTYVLYTVNLNRNGMLTGNGPYVMTDQIPEGMECVGVRCSGFSGYYAEHIKIESLEGATGWTKGELMGKMWYYGSMDQATYETGDKCIYYYNKTTNEVRWAVENILHTSEGSSGVLSYQVICKVVDDEVLLGTKTGSYTNKAAVYMYDDENLSNMTKMGDAVCGPYIISKSSFNKEMTVDENHRTNSIPFTITVNEVGEDLLKKSDTIVLVDKMSASLTLDVDSIKVKDKNNQDVTFTSELETDSDGKTILKLTIPDNKKLTITYNASVSVAANKKVAIENVAYWEGYETTQGSKTVSTEYSYNVQFSVLGAGNPYLKIVKMDEENTNLKLQGAVFSLQAVEYKDADGDGNKEFVETGDKHTATTGTDGIAYFSKDDTEGYWLKYDTIYCLKEVTAPAGYDLDDTPVYVVIDGHGNDYPDGVKITRNSAEGVVYATNKKQIGDIKVSKQFQNSDGSAMAAPEGTFRFALYEAAETLGDPLEILSIQYSKAEGSDTVTPTYKLQQGSSGTEKTVTEPKFADLDISKTYCVYELDADGSPILNSANAVTLCETDYAVSYQNNANLKLTPNVELTTTVTNQIAASYSLPMTGGSGVSCYIFAGLMIMMLSAAGYLLYAKKQ